MHESISDLIILKGNIRSYLIVESVSFVLLQDVSPKKTIEIVNSRIHVICIKPLYLGFIQIHPLNL